MKRKMVARREMKYATRRLKAGDVFDALGGNGRVFAKLGWADYVDEGREPVAIPPIPETLKNRVMAGKPVAPDPVDEPADDLRAVRAEYETKLGKRPFFGWGAEELRRRITEAAS